MYRTFHYFIFRLFLLCDRTGWTELENARLITIPHVLRANAYRMLAPAAAQASVQIKYMNMFQCLKFRLHIENINFYEFLCSAIDC